MDGGLGNKGAVVGLSVRSGVGVVRDKCVGIRSEMHDDRERGRVFSYSTILKALCLCACLRGHVCVAVRSTCLAACLPVQ